MTKPNRFLKIFNIYDGTTRNFYKEEIENLEIIEQVNPSNKELSINEATTVILPQNTKGVQFQRTLPLNIYKNGVLFGRFFINTSKSNTYKTVFKINAEDYINILEDQVYMGERYANTLVSTVISNILGDIPYDLDSELGEKRIYGFLPITDKRDALKQIAFAIDALIDTSRSDVIKIKPLPTTVSATIGKDKIVSISRIEKNITTEYDLEVTDLSEITSTRDVIFNDTITEDTTIIFNTQYSQLQITGGTIVSSNINYAIISGNGTVTLTGIPFNFVSNTYKKINQYTSSTDIIRREVYSSTLRLSNINTKLNNMKFVKYEIESVFKMDDVKVGDIVMLDGEKCRIKELSYDVTQTNIYSKAKCEVYYE